MNEYLASPVTPIVISVLAIALSIAAILKVRSNRRKRRKMQEEAARRHRERQEELERGRRIKAAAEKGKPLRRVRLQDVISNRRSEAREVIRGERSATSTSSQSRRYDPATDAVWMNAAAFGWPGDSGGRSSNDCGPGSTSGSGGDGGSSSGSSWSSDSGGGGSYGGGSSSSDSGSSGGGGDSGGGGGGGCD